MLPRLVGLLSLLLLVAAGCDTSGGSTPPVEPPGPPEAIAWEAPSLVPIDVEGFPTYPDLAVSSGAAVLAFHDVREGDPYDAPGDVYVTRRSGDGWAEPVNVSNTESPSSRPVVAAGAGGALHLVWGERLADATPRPGGVPDALYYARSTDGGRTWSAPEEVFASRSDGFFSLPRSLAVDAAGDLHLAFSSKETDDAPATVKHAERRASGWTEAEPVATGGSPDIALVGDGQLALTYLSADTSQDAPDRNSLFFARSDDGGASWSAPELIERSGYDQPAQSPRLEAVPGSQGLHLVWRKSTSGDLAPEAVFSSYSEDEGSTWTEARQVSFSASGTPSAPEVVVGKSGIANTAFQVGGAGASSFPAFFTRCAEAACTETESLFGTSGAGRHIGLAAEGGRHYIALRAIDFEGGQGIYFSISADE